MSATQFWIYMLTIVLAPLIAVQVTEFVNRRRMERDRRLWIFRTLMATRASRVNQEHVRALNMIDIEFYGTDSRSQAVLGAWKAYLNHLNTQSPPDLWISRGDDLFFELLYQMARSLGYSLDKTDMRATSYFPGAHVRFEADRQKIWGLLLEVLEGKRPLFFREDEPEPGTDPEV